MGKSSSLDKIEKLGTRASHAPKPQNLAEYISGQIQFCGKQQNEIAREAGFPKPNVISMIKTGATKLPLEKIGKFAKAIEVDPVFLLKLAMQEYMPATWQEIEKMFGQPILSINEFNHLAETDTRNRKTQPILTGHSTPISRQNKGCHMDSPVVFWRRERESNPPTKICSLLPNRSDIAPKPHILAQLWRS